MEMTVEQLWQLLEAHQGETFYTAKGLPFRYTVRGGELFVDRRAKSITVSTVASAVQAAQQLLAQGQPITGPKKLGCYGASYLYPVLQRLSVIPAPDWEQINIKESIP